MLRAVFFDAADTLFEPRASVGESYARSARDYGLTADSATVSAAFRRAFHQAPALAFGPGWPATELRRLERRWWRNLVEETFAGLGSFTDFDAYFDALFKFFADPASWRADPEVLPLLRTLRERGLILGVISNFDHRIYHILDGLGLSPYFDSITISSEAGWAKPAAELFNAALARHDVKPREALHVGDSKQLDLLGAQAAGLAAVIIDRGAAGGVEVAGRTARVASMSEIPEIMLQVSLA